MDKGRLELFIDNVQIIKDEFKWESILTKIFSAMIYSFNNKVIDCDAIRDSAEIIRKNSKAFSYFRGTSFFNIATMLSIRDERDVIVKRAMKIYEMLKKIGFYSSFYLTVAAYQIAVNVEDGRECEVVERAKEFFDGMKKEHRFLTGQDDYIFAAMIGISNIDIEYGLKTLKEIEGMLIQKLSYNNAVQSMSQILLLNEDTPATVNRLIEVHDLLNEKNYKVYSDNLIQLGILSLVPEDPKSIVEEIIEVYDYLHNSKKFKWMMTKQQLLMLSMSFAAFDMLGGIKFEVATAAISNNMINIMLAEQAVMANIVSSSTIVVTSNN
ncbi:MAG: DUF4003 domain-containing protein [Clostridioides sp.]|nr:DUF4003 domain-containing protein [Clostridioides sp.]